MFDHDEDDPSVDSVRLFIGNGSLGKIVDKWKLLGETYEKKVWSDLDVISSSSSSSSLSSSSKSLESMNAEIDQESDEEMKLSKSMKYPGLLA